MRPSLTQLRADHPILIIKVKPHKKTKNKKNKKKTKKKNAQYIFFQGKKVSNEQELKQSDPISCTQNHKGKNLIHKLTAVYERHAR